MRNESGPASIEAIIDAISDHHPAKAGSALKSAYSIWEILFLAYALQGECGGEPADTTSDDGDRLIRSEALLAKAAVALHPPMLPSMLVNR